MPVKAPTKPRTKNTSSKILERLLLPKKADFSPEAARAILKIEFQPADRASVDFLSAKASSGTLTSSEREELGEFIRVADMLAMLQAKARLSLKKAGFLDDES